MFGVGTSKEGSLPEPKARSGPYRDDLKSCIGLEACAALLGADVDEAGFLLETVVDAVCIAVAETVVVGACFAVADTAAVVIEPKLEIATAAGTLVCVEARLVALTPGGGIERFSLH